MSTEIIAYQPAPSGAPAVLGTMDVLRGIRTFIAEELVLDVDYGAIPGTGTKKVMLLPGAQKVAMYLDVYPEYDVAPTELGNGHVEYVVTTRLISRQSSRRVGTGLGSCSTMEGKYRFRNAQRVCPDCGKASIIQTKKGRNPGGYWCVPDKGGCGANFDPGDRSVEGQVLGKVENDNVHDQRNTVLKMAKKRSMVDAAIGLACLADMFTQDIEDTYDLAAAAPPVTEPEATSRPPQAPPADARREARAGYTTAPKVHQPEPVEEAIDNSPAPVAPRSAADTAFAEDLGDYLDESQSPEDFLDRVVEALEKVSPGAREPVARRQSLVNRILSDATAAARSNALPFDWSKILKPARPGEEPKRDPAKFAGAIRYLVNSQAGWTIDAAVSYVLETRDKSRAERAGRPAAAG